MESGGVLGGLARRTHFRTIVDWIQYSRSVDTKNQQTSPAALANRARRADKPRAPRRQPPTPALAYNHNVGTFSRFTCVHLLATSTHYRVYWGDPRSKSSNFLNCTSADRPWAGWTPTDRPWAGWTLMPRPRAPFCSGAS